MEIVDVEENWASHKNYRVFAQYLIENTIMEKLPKALHINTKFNV
ncbi:hypothetical protein OCV88_13485 [Brotonthovivens ammoniilytica]|uniref:Uncharacterized protein n=1 Tax=Brotonthovivens ammoniilytica TaxID=2981725 RepID=A0ABT2TM78_9FIRM|nr:hypothetical protein [Brotonthovivens ammoniilytica]MCU6763324.1 hypothetical protein [Brotonthovivens ammoniilytica]